MSSPAPRPHSVLVTGGAGYIGAHVVRLLRARGVPVLVVDDLSTGSRARIGDAPFLQLDLAAADARASLVAALRAHHVDAVLHFAAMKQVGESVTLPTRYFDRNIGGMTNLLAAMEQCGVDQFVFSSSAAVYGRPTEPLVREDAHCRPANPYGQSKLVGEWMTENAAAAWGLRAVNLRYFNVAGTGWADLRDTGVTNLVPIVIAAARARRPVHVFGTDWPTPDGTCIRDYIHVLDLAHAHLAALDHLRTGDAPCAVFNLGTGTGTSVLDIVRLVAEQSGRPLPVVEEPPRAGDPAVVVADPTCVNTMLGWRARHGIREIVRSTWVAARIAAHPELLQSA